MQTQGIMTFTFKFTDIFINLCHDYRKTMFDIYIINGLI